MVHAMKHLASLGYVFVTVNGLAFDFSILAEESGLIKECSTLALDHHCDLLFMSVCRFGWRTGLDAFCAGAGVDSKLHEVRLSTGEIVADMDGAMAPQLWRSGEYGAVLAYLTQDVKSTLSVAETALEFGELAWKSKKGHRWSIPLGWGGGLPTVADCLSWPEPDVSWMDNHPLRHEMMSWMWV